MTKAMISVALLVLSSTSVAVFQNQWVDDDYNTATPPVQMQICDSAIDIPAINNPGVQPIQRPSIKPIEPPTIPPIGTTNCRTQQVYENGTWVNKQICS